MVARWRYNENPTEALRMLLWVHAVNDVEVFFDTIIRNACVDCVIPEQIGMLA